MVEKQNVPTLGIPKDDFLAHVRRSLGRPETSSPATPYPRLLEKSADLQALAAEARRRIGENTEELAGRFADTARLRNWNVFRTTDSEDAVGYIVELCLAHSAAQVARSDQPVFAELPVDSALQAVGIRSIVASQHEADSRQAVRQHIIDSGVGLTGADYAVTETGSVVIVPRKGLSRLVSLVPPVHVAVVRLEDLVETLDDVFLFRRLEYHRNGGEMGSYLNFITGPSRTADIEMKLVVGGSRSPGSPPGAAGLTVNRASQSQEERPCPSG